MEIFFLECPLQYVKECESFNKSGVKECEFVQLPGKLLLTRMVNNSIADPDFFCQHY